jgi:hypothetical protein
VIHTPGESFDTHESVASVFAEPDAASITIPDAHLLFTAEFNRKGSDLVLTGDDGHKVLVADYFRHEKQPDLVSPEGALLSASLVELLAGSVATAARSVSKRTREWRSTSSSTIRTARRTPH